MAKIWVSLLTAADGGPASAELVDVFPTLADLAGELSYNGVAI